MTDEHPRPDEAGDPRPASPPPPAYWHPAQQTEDTRPYWTPHPAAAPERSRGRVSPWIWPAVALLALLVGLVGGALGGLVITQVQEQDPVAGQVEGGLPEVETREAAPLPAGNGSVAAVANELLPSTVQIIAQHEGRAAGATGSGFVLDRQGHVVTNNHVVASAAEEDGPIEVVDHEGTTYDATVVGRSPVYDLAVLHLEKETGLEPAALGSAQAMRVGDQVVAFGAPLGLSQTVTSGIVSAKDRPVTTGESGDDSSYINAIQTDAAINPGNSGGPLVNLAGEVVGVNSAIATTGGMLSGEGGNIGVGFAIPIEQVRVTVDQILRTGEARYPVIGAQVRTGGAPRLDGARITEVMDGTPAQDAGLRAGDVIREVEGDRVTDGIALIVAIRTHQPGESIEFTVLRDGEERTIEVTLDGKVG